MKVCIWDLAIVWARLSFQVKAVVCIQKKFCCVRWLTRPAGISITTYIYKCERVPRISIKPRADGKIKHSLFAQIIEVLLTQLHPDWPVSIEQLFQRLFFLDLKFDVNHKLLKIRRIAQFICWSKESPSRNIFIILQKSKI